MRINQKMFRLIVKKFNNGAFTSHHSIDVEIQRNCTKQSQRQIFVLSWLQIHSK